MAETTPAQRRAEIVWSVVLIAVGLILRFSAPGSVLAVLGIVGVLLGLAMIVRASLALARRSNY